jgi:colanic acid/amylovoran biosynthesis protein
MPEPKNVVITNVFGAKNRGDAALVEALVDHIARAFPGAHVSGIANDVEHEREFLPAYTWLPAPFRAKGRSFQRLWNAVYVVSYLVQTAFGVPVERLVIFPRDQKTSLCAIRDSDLVVSCAGGFLLDINLSYYMNLLQMDVAARYGIPFVISPQTIGPINGRFARWLGKRVLSRAAHIFVREDFSMRFMRNEFGFRERLEYFPDLALGHGRRDPEGGAQALRDLGLAAGEHFISASVLDWAFPGVASKQAAQADYEARFARAVIEVLNAAQCRVVFINQVSSDLPVARRVAALIGKRAIVDDFDRTPATIRGMLAQSGLMIASRFHSCIFGMLEGAPVQAISYNYKTDGIMEKIGLSDRVWPIDSFDPHELAQAGIATLSHGERRFLLDEKQSANFAEILRGIAAKAHVGAPL